MAFEPEFLSMMPFTVDVAPFVGLDRNNEASYGDAVTYRARIVGKVISLRRSEKEDATPVFDIYLGAIVNLDGTLSPVGNTLFTTNDKVTLPVNQGWVDETPIIFAVARATDEDGTHHVKLQCGFMYHRQGQ